MKRWDEISHTEAWRIREDLREAGVPCAVFMMRRLYTLFYDVFYAQIEQSHMPHLNAPVVTAQHNYHD